jgi:hypothetical protein
MQSLSNPSNTNQPCPNRPQPPPPPPRSEIVDTIAEYLASTPQSLGDPRKDSPEEMEERHERVVAASLAAIPALLAALAAPAAAAASGSSAGDAAAAAGSNGGEGAAAAAAREQQQLKAAAEVEGRLGALLAAPGFFKRHLGSKSALVRRSAYGMVAGVAKAAPALLGAPAGVLEPAAQAVLGALGEKDAGCHPAMWEMALMFVRAQPGCWAHVSLQKMVLPRLWALLRGGCVGAAAGSLPALLPFVAALPRQLLAPAAGEGPTTAQPFFQNLCDALWQGLPLCGGAGGRDATVAAYRELLGWALRNSGKLAALSNDQQQQEQQQDEAAPATAEQQRAYCSQLLAAHFAPALLPLALGGRQGQAGDAAAALEVVQGLLLELVGGAAGGSSTAAALPLEAEVVVAAVSKAAAAALAHAEEAAVDAAAAAPTAAPEVVVIGRLTKLVDALQPAGEQAAAGGATAAATAAQRLMQAVAAALAPKLDAGVPLSAAASALLSQGVARFGVLPQVGGGAGSSSDGDDATAMATALVRAGLEASSGAGSGGEAAAATADLLVACLLAAVDPVAAWSNVLEQLSNAAATGDLDDRLQFAALLLRRLALSAGTRKQVAAGSWRCDALDRQVARLFGDVAAGGPTEASADALAEMVGVALGGNATGLVLLGDAAAAELLAAVQAAAAAARGGGGAAAVTAATCGVEALSAALAAEGVADSSSTSSSSNSGLWQRQGPALAQLVPEVFALSWDHPGEQSDAAATEAAAVQAWTAAEAGSGSGSGTDDGGESDLDESSSDAGGSDDAAGSEQGAKQDAGADAELAAARAAAARLWDSGALLSTALDRAPPAELEPLVGRVSGLVVDSVAAAAAATAAGEGVEDGRIWAHRAAAAAHGLRRHPHLRLRLVEQVLSAVPSWQAWCAPGSSGSGSGSSSTDFLTEVAATLVLRSGAEVSLAAAQQLAHSSSSSAAASSSGGGSSGAGERVFWLVGELLCARRAAGAAASANLSDTGPLLARAALAAAARGDAGAPAGAAGLLRVLWRGASGEQLDASDPSVGSEACGVYASALTELVQLASAPALSPLLQAFCSAQLQPAAARARQLPTGPAESLEAAVGALAPVLRAAGEGAVSSSGLDQMSSSVCRQAIDEDAGSSSGSSGGEEGQQRLVRLLRLAVAHFPVDLDGPAGRGAPVVGASTAAERQALMALLRHASSSSSCAADGGCGAEGERLASALQLRGVCFGWRDMAAAEWHAVLRDVQRHISAGRTAAQRAAGRLAAAACGAAQQLVGGGGGEEEGGAAEPMAPATAVQLLTKLSSKGLLQGHPAQAQLLATFRDALAAAGLGACWLPSLQLLAAVLRLQDAIQDGGRAPQLQLALGAAQSELLALLMALGAALAVAASAGPQGAAPVLRWLDGRAAEWRLVAGCLEGADDAAAAAALAAADGRCEMVGVDAVACLLALLHWPAASVAAAHHQHHHHHAQQRHHHHKQQQQRQARRSSLETEPSAAGGAGASNGSGNETAAPPGSGCRPLEEVAWRLSLQPAALALITFAEGAAAADEAEGVAAPELDDQDPIGFLVQIGLRPETAGALVGYMRQHHHHAPWQPALLQWALLLVHGLALPARGPAARRLAQALRDVPELVPSLLDRLVSIMGLSGGRGAAAAGGAGAAAQAAAHAQLAEQLSALCLSPAAAAAAEADSAGDGGWSLRAALLAAGPPASAAGWRVVAAACYRAVLRALPASARLWFGDLRDRGRAAAVEAYTAKHESPALLAAEFAAIRRDGGGGENFRVRANAAGREVVAQLEIEDGASLDLLVKLPSSTPLRPAEVECRNKVRGSAGARGAGA